MSTDGGPRAKPKVVIIRGDFLCKRNLQYYEPLADRFDLLGVSVRRNEHDLSLLDIPVVRPWSPDSVLAGVPPLQFVVDRALRLRSENLMYLWGLRNICKGAAVIDIAETFHPFCLQAVRIKQKTGARLVVRQYENIPFAHENLGFRRRVKKLVYKWADAFLPCSELGRRAMELEGAPPDKIRVVPMGVDTERFFPQPKDESVMDGLGLAGSDFVVLFAGRLIWEKGVFDLVNAAALLKSLSSLRIVFAGSGPELRAVQQRIARLGITHMVRFAGKLPPEKMPGLYSIADVMAAPSISTRKWQEQFGAVIIEAMACGRAVIVSDSGSIPEVVDDCALAVPQADYVALAEAIRRLHDERGLAQELGKRGRSRVLDRFTNEIVSDLIGSVYDGLLQRGGPRAERRGVRSGTADVNLSE